MVATHLVRSRVVGLLGIWLVGLGLTTGATAASSAPPSGKLIFCAGTTSAKCQRALYIANGDGTGVRRLGATPVVPRNLTWSPRGDRFLFTGYRTITPYGLYLGDIQGHIRQVAKGYINGFAWTPGGSSFAYVTATSETSSGTSKLIIESATTLTQRSPVVGNSCRPIDGPFISPDGTKAAFNTAGGAACKSGLSVLDLRSGKSRLVYAFSPIHRVIVIAWRNATSLIVSEGYPGASHARLLTTSGHLGKLIPGDPNVLPAQTNEDGDAPYWSSLAADGSAVLLSVESCQSSTVCGFGTSILDLHSHKVSENLPADSGGWSKHGSQLMTYAVDDSKTSTTLQLLSGAALSQDWSASLPMPIGELAWSG